MANPNRHPIAYTLLYAALAFVADWFAPPIFIGHTLVLGVVFYWLAMHSVGHRAALVVLAASFGALWAKWGQPYSGGLIALEGLWVGIRWRARRNPLWADVVFWVVFGTPVSWFFYRQVYPIPHPSFEHALVIQPINGVIALWMAYLGREFLLHPASGERPEGFREFLLKRYIAFGTLPVLIAGLLAARIFEDRAMSEAKYNLRATAQNLALTLGREVARGTSLVQQVAGRQAEANLFADSSRLVQELGAAHRREPLFLTMLVADAQGRVVASSPAPAPAPEGRPAPVISVADRDYFQRPLQSETPFVSGIFRGRGLGNDPIIAVSAPVISSSGAKLGVVEGSIDVGKLNRIVQGGALPETRRAVLTDRNATVIAAAGFELKPLATLENTALGRYLTKPLTEAGRFTDSSGPDKVIYLSISVPVPETTWTLTLQRTWSDMLQPVIASYLLILGVATGTALLAYFFAAWSIRGILAAWRALIDFARRPEPDLLEQADRAHLPNEFKELLDNLADMARRLHSEKSQREQLLAELETRVRERTSELEFALDRARSADRAKTAFLATVSHELRTPLTSIINGAALLRLGKSDRSSMELRTLNSVDKASQVLKSVITNVLDYSKLEAGGVTIESRSFSPGSVIADVVAVLSANVKSSQLDIRVRSLHRADLTWQGDPDRIRQVLLNLAGNALKFTERGFVEIASWTVAGEDGRPARLCFAVNDSGPGIPADRLQAIFEPFVQLEGNRLVSQAGTGLGLTISRKLVTMMGGEITAHSRVGQGSTFEFWLPAAPRA